MPHLWGQQLRPRRHRWGIGDIEARRQVKAADLHFKVEELLKVPLVKAGARLEKERIRHQTSDETGGPARGGFM